MGEQQQTLLPCCPSNPGMTHGQPSCVHQPLPPSPKQRQHNHQNATPPQMDDFFLATPFDADQYVDGRRQYRTTVAHLRAHRTTWRTNLLARLPAGSDIRLEASTAGRGLAFVWFAQRWPALEQATCWRSPERWRRISSPGDAARLLEPSTRPIPNNSPLTAALQRQRRPGARGAVRQVQPRPRPQHRRPRLPRPAGVRHPRLQLLVHRHRCVPGVRAAVLPPVHQGGFGGGGVGLAAKKRPRRSHDRRCPRHARSVA
jgi:hypothetical protein